MSEIITEDIIDIIKNNVMRSTLFTTKNITKCELTDKFYPEDENNLIFYSLKGARAINQHHCYGSIVYHKENEKYLKYADMFYECYDNVIQHHSLQNKKINILRSSGKIETVLIPIFSPIKLFSDSRGLSIFVEISKNKIWKWVSFADKYSKSLKKNVLGVINLNPKLFEENLEIFFRVENTPLKEQRQQLLNTIKIELNKLAINYKITNPN
ncbi:hypothetical protein CPAV1605_1401 [seawater metagenome]|uniref:Uncharacterized protein n=1 Tax=seawater metagenome TaxID=1561972 RepID=A0A5E8CJZ2_9ZZZZ